MKNFMKSITKTMFATAITASLLVSTTVIATTDHSASQLLLPRHNSIVDDVTKIMTSPAASKAYAAIKMALFKKLQTTKMPVGKSALLDFINFVSKNQTLFDKWQSISADFAQEIIATMSIEDILANIGLTTETIQPVCRAYQSADAAIAEDKAKNAVITKILDHSKGALAGIIGSLGLGLSTIAEYVGARAKRVEAVQAIDEDPVQAALRKSLKKNLTLQELQALYTFSQTSAFNTIASSFEEVKKILLQVLSKEDPRSLAMLAERLQAFATSCKDTKETALAGGIAEITITTAAAAA